MDIPLQANPLGCAVALAGLDIFANENVLQRIDEISTRMCDRLKSFTGNKHFRDVRQIGDVGIIELEDQGDGYFAEIGPRFVGIIS